MRPRIHFSRRLAVSLSVVVVLAAVLVVLLVRVVGGGRHGPTDAGPTTAIVAPTPTTEATTAEATTAEATTGTPGHSPTAGTGTGAVPPTSGSPAGSRPPTSGSPAGSPAAEDLEVYRARCRESAGELVRARAVYPARLHLTLHREATFAALVTFDKSVQPGQALPGTPGAIAVPIGVTCQVEARLLGSEDAFEISPADWQSRALFEGQSANWTWFVTPKKGGARKLILELQPIVKVAGQPDVNLTGAVPVTVPFVSDVRVDVPAGERIAGAATGTRTVVEVVAGVLAALGGFFAAVKGVQWRRRKAAGGAELDADPATIIAGLRRLRIERGVGADDVAQALGVSRRVFSALEEGDRVPTYRNVHDYARALNVDLTLRPGPAPAARPPSPPGTPAAPR